MAGHNAGRISSGYHRVGARRSPGRASEVIGFTAANSVSALRVLEAPKGGLRFRANDPG